MLPKLFSFTHFRKNASASPFVSHTFKTKDLKPFRITHFQKKGGGGRLPHQVPLPHLPPLPPPVAIRESRISSFMFRISPARQTPICPMLSLLVGPGNRVKVSSA